MSTLNYLPPNTRLPNDILAVIIAMGWNDIYLTRRERLRFFFVWILMSRNTSWELMRVFLTNVHIFNSDHHTHLFTRIMGAKPDLIFASPRAPEVPMCITFVTDSVRFQRLFPNLRTFGLQYLNWAIPDPRILRVELPKGVETFRIALEWDKGYEATRETFKRAIFTPQARRPAKVRPHIKTVQILDGSISLKVNMKEACAGHRCFQDLTRPAVQ
ncbi:hypothetical protein CYLTODRAFT_490956 [Cylindrobasidium torrendii FP15055 ss-10]|uniref:Uncharacterized protein n=1 Tax=Cylindrobasidium torrendii FP15055 ss-10 TaxID=1314674 RepID=A0A0D7BA63_9AGAR|nr:hypothetical protein CYLTODRAFT_490956 [Cylindrobasidium torrendii FP15055 ss-10]